MEEGGSKLFLPPECYSYMNLLEELQASTSTYRKKFGVLILKFSILWSRTYIEDIRETGAENNI
jgi:hypothetical protein